MPLTCILLWLYNITTLGWAPGRIVKLHYSEPNWPPNM